MRKHLVTRISQFITHFYSTPRMIGLFVVVGVFFWLFNFSSLPLSNPELVRLSGGEGLLDLRPFYTASEAYAALEHFGQAGRELYLRFLVADFIFIPVYSLAFGFLVTRTIRAACGENSAWLWLNVVPLGIGFYDSIENLSVFGMLKLFPTNNPVLGTVAGFATLGKTLLSVAVFLLLSGCGFLVLMRQAGFNGRVNRSSQP